ncbi:MAG TPA: glucose-6-phosphate dehydrogenase assembly protein OpcA [Chloroflexota bacterium]
MNTVATTLAEWNGTDIDMTTVQRQFTALWGSINDGGNSGVPVRTSMFNLVVYTDSSERASQVAENVAGLTGRRPSRLIILVGDRMSENCIVDASVRLRCQGSLSSGQAYEEVIMWAHGRAADHLASVVIPLLLPELHTYLLWTSQPPFGLRLFHRLLGIADRVVVDSSLFKSPGDGLANLARLTRSHRQVLDFHWARLGPWREMIAQFFDNADYLPYARAIRSVRLEFGREGNLQSATVGSLLVLGWIASRLGWEPETTLDEVATGDVALAALDGERLVTIDLQFRDHGANAAGRLVGMELVSQPKGLPAARFSIWRAEDLSQAEVATDVYDGPKHSRIVPLISKSDSTLLAEELQVAGHDPLYDEVVAMASRMAGREVWLTP